MYDKSRKRRGNTDYIVRFLPTAVSQIVVQYLVYVRPFARALDHRESEYLFADERGPMAGEQLSQQLAKDTQKYLKVRLTTRGYRQVAVSIAVRKLGKASRTWENEEGMTVKQDEEEDEEEEEEDGEMVGEDEREMALDTFRHVLIR
jgi:hypothetical protein